MHGIPFFIDKAIYIGIRPALSLDERPGESPRFGEPVIRSNRDKHGLARRNA